MHHISYAVWCIAGIIAFVSSLDVCFSSGKYIRAAWLFISISALSFIIGMIVYLYFSVNYSLFMHRVGLKMIFFISSFFYIIAFFLLSQSREISFKIKRHFLLVVNVFITVIMTSCILNYRGEVHTDKITSVIYCINCVNPVLFPFIIGLSIYFVSLRNKDGKIRLIFMLLMASVLLMMLRNAIGDSSVLMRSGYADLLVTCSLLLVAISARIEVRWKLDDEYIWLKEEADLFYVPGMERILPGLSIAVIIAAAIYNLNNFSRSGIGMILIMLILYTLFIILFEWFGYRSEDSLVTLLSSSPAGIMMTDRKLSKIYFINRSLYNIFRTSRIYPDTLVRNNLNEENRNELINNINIGKCLENVEISFIREDGSIFYSQCMILPTKHYSLDIIISWVIDITDRKKNEILLLENEKKIKEMEKSKAIAQMAGGLAHDLNNKLMGIGTYASLIELKLKEPGVKKYTDGIQNIIHEGAELIGNMLIFAGQTKYREEDISIHRILHDAVAGLDENCRHGVIINERFEALNDNVKGDVYQLQKSLSDIMINSLDAMPAGGTLDVLTDNTVPGDIFLTELSDGDTDRTFILIKISDTGIGIDKENIGRIFDPFYTTKPVGKGHGLNLSAVYGTIQAHGGAIRVLSNPGEGAVFYVFLPLG